MPSSRPTTQEMEVGICHTAPMPGSQTPFQYAEVGISHTAPMPGGQLIIPSRGLGIRVGVCPLPPMPGGHPFPRSGVNYMDPCKFVLSSFPLFQEDSFEAGRPTAVPGGSGVG
ncbi:hypothetical protein E2C01_049703 [Portunus trituberculatus]|uniref:Uncharacterized protein n=1 Tax=Portunus trituberculatus TaxID=210409 RepID=A0A5B7GDT7_PORTR|nr:hypothetical protein [Portunus trituberculatus]